MSETQTQTQTPTTTTVQTVQAVPRREIAAGPRGLQLETLDDMWRFSDAVARSGLAPKGLETKEAIFVALEMGAEVGLPPMASLQNIAVINGRPSIWGDAQLAVVRATGELEEFSETWEVAGKRLARPPLDYPDALTAVCRAKRRGFAATESAFSVADAKRARLWNPEAKVERWKKDGSGKYMTDNDAPWHRYPARMLQMRARSFALRDQFGDALRGLMTAEEAMDEPRAEVAKAANVVEIVAEPADFVPEVAAQAEPQPQPQAEPQDDPKATPSVRLGQYLEGHGVTFNTFQAWGRETGQLETPIQSWADIPETVARRLWQSRVKIAQFIGTPEATLPL